MTDKHQDADRATSDQPELASPHVAKIDPESLALRARVPNVIRFKRGLIVGIAGLGSVAIIGVTWIALKPSAFKMMADVQSQISVDHKRPPEALAGAPGSYADVPKLGPPLPGDLGRPILAREQALGGLPPTDQIAAQAATQASERAAQAAEAERQRIAAELKAAREAGVMVRTTETQSVRNNPDVTSGGATNAAVPGDGTVAASATGSQAPDPGGQSRKQAFLDRPSTGDDINPHRLAAATSPWTLSAGSIIAASLITGLNSDLPGFVTAQVTENAYDSVTGRTVLIPQGSRLIGNYDSVVAFGQKRALLVWQRLILPDGSSIRIDNAPASDASGYAGLSDHVDFHTWSLLKGIGLSTLLGVGTSLTFGSGESDLVRAIRESTQQNADRAGQQITAKNLDVQPTITVRPGYPLRIVVHKDLVLQPWQNVGGR